MKEKDWQAISVLNFLNSFSFSVISFEFLFRFPENWILFNMGFFPFGDNSFILKCYFLYARPFGRKRFMNFCLLMPIAFWFLLFEFLLMVWHLMTFSFNKRSHAYRRWNQRRMSLTIGMLWLSLLRFRSSILSFIVVVLPVTRSEWEEETPVSNGPLNERKRDQEKIDRENVLTVKENIRQALTENKKRIRILERWAGHGLMKRFERSI